MSPNKNYLHHLRNKPEPTKNIIAAVFAIVPALLVGYAQFYMNAKASADKVAMDNNTSQASDVQEVSALASVGKIFSEGKSTINDTLGQLKKIDQTMLENVSDKQIILNTSSSTDATNTSVIKVDSAIKNTTE